MKSNFIKFNRSNIFIFLQNYLFFHAYVENTFVNMITTYYTLERII